jgi:nucleotide-binding universal stress UspA family protein
VAIGEQPDAGNQPEAKDELMQRILVATDGSPSAADAVRIALELAVEQGAAVTFVHVVSPPFARPSEWLDAAAQLHQPLDDRDNETAVEAAAKLAREAGVDAEVVIVAGRAADEIVAYADTIDADLIVVG